jgi:hypothetical protein
MTDELSNVVDEQFAQAPERAHWRGAAEATALGDRVLPDPVEAWPSRLRDSTLLVLAVVAHEHEVSVKEIRRAVGHRRITRLSLRTLERLELVGCERRPGHNLWYPTPEGAQLGVTPYVARLLSAIRPRYRGYPREGMSVGRFRNVGTMHGPPIFSPAWTLEKVTDPQILAKSIRSGTKDAREYALSRLVALNDPASVKVLCEIVQTTRGNDEEFIRKGVIALGSFDSPAAVDTLIDIASHRDSLMREPAVRALGRLRAPAAIPVLIDLINYPSEPVRAAALTALGRIGDQASADAVAIALEDSHFEVRHSAREALVKLGAIEQLRHNRRRFLPLRALDTSHARVTAHHHHRLQQND